MTNSEEVEVIHTLSYCREDGSYSLWDHPNFKSFLLALPQEATLTLRQIDALSEMRRWSVPVQEERLRILKVIGDAVCTNENQLRRYMSMCGYSSTKTSEHVSALRKRGFVQRYRCVIEDYRDEVSGDYKSLHNPAPITLDYGGWFLLNYYYSGQFFVDPGYWLQQGSAGIQRYVALNELRCVGVESHAFKNWKWFPTILSNKKMRKPFALIQLGELDDEYDTRSYMLVERAQLSQNFAGFLRTRLEVYRALYEKHGYIPIAGVDKEADIRVVLSVSSASVAQRLQEDIGLHKYPFDVWVVVDEWFDSGEAELLKTSFGRPSKDFKSIQRLRLNL